MPCVFLTLTGILILKGEPASICICTYRRSALLNFVPGTALGLNHYPRIVIYIIHIRISADVHMHVYHRSVCTYTYSTYILGRQYVHNCTMTSNIFALHEATVDCCVYILCTSITRWRQYAFLFFLMISGQSHVGLFSFRKHPCIDPFIFGCS